MMRLQPGKHRCKSILAGLLVALVGSIPARAEIVSVSDSTKGNILDPSSEATGATLNFFQDTGKNVKVHGWDESQNVTLSQNLYVDTVNSGTYSNFSQMAGHDQAYIAAGTTIDSHMLYYDPKVGKQLDNVTFTFSGTILGVIVSSDRFYNKANGFDDYFVDSDFLGNPNTIYPGAHFDRRGLELNGADQITVSISGNSITIDHLAASTPGDQIRILTLAIPEPSTFLALGIPMLLGAGYRVLRSRRRQ